MITIKTLTEYDPKLAKTMGKLLTQLSTNWDGSPITREWIENIIESPWHDQLLALDDHNKLVGMATMSAVLGAKIGRNAYLEDFVVDASCRGQGIGTKMWEKIVKWGKTKACNRLEFTASGNEKKSGAVQFYLKRGVQIYDTNFFRLELNKK